MMTFKDLFYCFKKERKRERGGEGEFIAINFRNFVQY